MANLSGVNKYFSVAKEGFATTTSAPIASGATTVQLSSVAGYSNGDTVVLVIDAGDVAKKQAFTGTVDTGGTQITNVVWTEGANTSHIIGAPVIDYVTASHQSMTTKGLLVSHDQDGTLKAGAVDVAGVLASNVVETAKIKDGAVTPEKLSTSPTGFGLQEIARTTLSSTSDTITISSIPAKKYLFIKAILIPTGGNITGTLKLNNDTGANYTIRYADNFAGGGSASLTSQSPTGWSDNGTASSVLVAEIKIANLAIYEKMAVGTIWGGNVSGAANATNIRYWSGKWANTTDQINRVDIINLGTGDYAAGSEVVILGHN